MIVREERVEIVYVVQRIGLPGWSAMFHGDGALTEAKAWARHQTAVRVLRAAINVTFGDAEAVLTVAFGEVPRPPDAG